MKIPKLIHFIWIGSNSQPKLFKDIFLEQWINLHPEYEVKIWTGEDLQKIKLQNEKYIMDSSINPGLRADALKLEIL